MIMEQSLDQKRKIENELKSFSHQQKDTRSSLDRPDENKFVFLSFVSSSTIRMYLFLFLLIMQCRCSWHLYFTPLVLLK